jgi:hypothetical protein
MNWPVALQHGMAAKHLRKANFPAGESGSSDQCCDRNG